MSSATSSIETARDAMQQIRDSLQTIAQDMDKLHHLQVSLHSSIRADASNITSKYIDAAEAIRISGDTLTHFGGCYHTG